MTDFIPLPREMVLRCSTVFDMFDAIWTRKANEDTPVQCSHCERVVRAKSFPAHLLLCPDESLQEWQRRRDGE